MNRARVLDWLNRRWAAFKAGFSEGWAEEMGKPIPAILRGVVFDCAVLLLIVVIIFVAGGDRS